MRPKICIGRMAGLTAGCTGGLTDGWIDSGKTVYPNFFHRRGIKCVFHFMIFNGEKQGKRNYGFFYTF